MRMTRTRMRRPEPVAVYGLIPAMLPRGFVPGPAQGPYREALMMRTYFFVSNWAWYEWAGALMPLAILWALEQSPGARHASRLSAASALPW